MNQLDGIGWGAVALSGFTALLTLVAVWLLLQLKRQLAAQSASTTLLPLIQQSNERLERALRDELTRSASGTRQELLQGLTQFQQTLSAQAMGGREAQDKAAQRSAQAQTEALQRLSNAMTEQLKALSQATEQRLAQVQTAVEQRLGAIQQDNEKKLEQMRATVDEKLHATLEQRLGESFKQVADRLEQVHKGLGEMQNLARDVGSLNRVLTNVKTRGIFGEVQLAGLLEQVFTAEQYA
ncbi:DNA recombination protein RmuC, partial [Roseateles sp. GG27B]